MGIRAEVLTLGVSIEGLSKLYIVFKDEESLLSESGAILKYLKLVCFY